MGKGNGDWCEKAYQGFRNKIHLAACLKPGANLHEFRQASKLEKSQFDFQDCEQHPSQKEQQKKLSNNWGLVVLLFPY